MLIILQYAANFLQGYSTEPAGAQVRELPGAREQEKDFPFPTAQFWFDEIKRRYHLQSNAGAWSECAPPHTISTFYLSRMK